MTPGRFRAATVLFNMAHPIRVLLPCLAATVLLLAAACESSANLRQSNGPGILSEGGQTSAEGAWVAGRTNAVAALYGLSSDGRQVVNQLDVRQMVGRPGYFGSFGFFGWTGIGEAKPIQVIHELGHSYWGAFPIEGLPDLSWRPDGGGLSPAMRRYHQDVLRFMAQPPDDFEPLRHRLRLLPELSSANTDPLFHTVEADLIYTVGGDLYLLPPILCKYFSGFLTPGPFHTWVEALSWYQALDAEDRRLANSYLGLEHLDLRRYGGLAPSRLEGVSLPVAGLLREEERQRLRDFALQFDLLTGPTDDPPDFRFWRGYLGDKLALHRREPGFLASLAIPNAARLADTLDFFAGLSGQTPDAKASLVLREMESRPLVAPLLPVLDNATLLALTRQGGRIPSGATVGGMREFVLLLKGLSPIVDRVLEAGRRDHQDGAKVLANYAGNVNFKEQREALRLFFGLLRGADRDVAANTVAALDDGLLRRLLEPVPAELRFTLEPPRLLSALGINRDAPPKNAAEGITYMVENTSGNFRIDEPFDEELYRLMAARPPKDSLDIIAAARFPVQSFILGHPKDAAAVFRANLDTTATLVLRSDPVTFPPARFVYRLVHADPTLAAELLTLLDQQGHRALVLDSLAHLAYDARRAAQFPISLEADGQFLAALLELHGSEWLKQALADSVERYQAQVTAGDLPPDFLTAYRQTLNTAAESLSDASSKETLQRLIGALPQE